MTESKSSFCFLKKSLLAGYLPYPTYCIYILSFVSCNNSTNGHYYASFTKILKMRHTDEIISPEGLPGNKTLLLTIALGCVQLSLS